MCRKVISEERDSPLPILSHNNFQKLFPFAFQIDSELQVHYVGDGWKKVTSLLSVGSALGDVFKLKRPVLPMVFEELVAQRENLFILELNQPVPFLVRGSFFLPDSARNSDSLLFIGEPWISSVNDLETSGMSLNDLPLHHPMGDLLLLLETERTNLKEMRDLSGKLHTSNEELKSREEILKEKIKEQLALEAQLRQSQKMEALGRLAGGIAHDFNNLLFAINGYAGLALNAVEGGSSAARSIQCIQQGADRAAALIEQLLTFSRQTNLNSVSMNLSKEIRELTFLLRPLLRNNIRLSLAASKHDFFCWMDKNALQQIIMNVVINAMDAMPEGGEIGVWIKSPEQIVASGLALDSFVEIGIQDTGMGMEDDVLSKVFEPFFTTKEVGKGTGLGLSMVHSLVGQCAGMIEVESKINEGTTLRVFLPRVQPKEEHSSSLIDNLLTEDGAAPIRVLLVEDDPLVRGILVQMLSNASFEVIAHSCPIAALRALSVHKEKVDIVVTDIVMPKMNGIEMARQISNGSSILPTLFITGDTKGLSLNKGTLPRYSRLLRKPFSAITLIQELRLLLKESVPEQRKPGKEQNSGSPIEKSSLMGV